MTDTPAGWSGYLKSRSSDGVTATVNVVLLRDLIEASHAPDDLVRAAHALHDDMVRRADIERDYRGSKEVVIEAGDGVWRNFCAALALPRRTEADIRADERERLAKMADRVADAEVAAAARADSDAFQRLDSALTQWKETP